MAIGDEASGQNIKRLILRSISERFRRRKASLFRKANALAYLINSNIYIFIAIRNFYFIYKLTNNIEFPPPEQEII